MTDYDKLIANVDEGIAGRNVGIPLEIPTLSYLINGLQKRTSVLLGGNTGTGKTAFVDYVYVLKVFDWWKANRDMTNVKVRWIYRSMERNKIYKIAKWTCIKLYEDHNILIDVPELLGWEASPRPNLYKDYIQELKPYFDELFEYVELIDGAENPTGIFKHVSNYALRHGTIEKESEFVKHYIENDPNLITIVIEDHIGKVKLERSFNKKETIDKNSEYMGIMRDFFGFNPIQISQFNRDIGDVQRFKAREVMPQLEDFKDSANTQEDADIVLALFNPWRYNINEYAGYKTSAFTSTENSENRFRSISILKNSYGVADVRLGTLFIGECGIFKGLKSASEMNQNPQLYVNAMNLGART